MKLFEKQVFIALSSKEQNIKAGSHCNFMIFQWEPDLTFFKWSKNWKHGHSKQAPVAKKAEKCPKIAQTLHLKSENGPLRIYPLFLTTLDCFCGTLVGKTELKCTKNFKALNLNFTKCNGTGFWRFGTDMTSKDLKENSRRDDRAGCCIDTISRFATVTCCVGLFGNFIVMMVNSISPFQALI